MNRHPTRERELSEQAMARLLGKEKDFVNPKVLLVILVIVSLAVVLGIPAAVDSWKSTGKPSPLPASLDGGNNSSPLNDCRLYVWDYGDQGKFIKDWEFCECGKNGSVFCWGGVVNIDPRFEDSK